MHDCATAAPLVVSSHLLTYFCWCLLLPCCAVLCCTSRAGSEDFSLPSGSSAAFSGPALQRAPVAAPARSGALAWADDPSLPPLRLPPASIGLLRQSELDAARAAAAVLPPLQSVLELTTAYRPPERTGAPVAAPAPDAAGAVEGEAGVDGASTAAATVGRALPDGSGKLADGTWWEKRSGVEYGEVSDSVIVFRTSWGEIERRWVICELTQM